MQLHRLSLTNYKNQKAFQLDFQAPINGFVGNNGVGKTNLLDAIYHLALGKSYFNPVATQNIHLTPISLSLKVFFPKKRKPKKLSVVLKKAVKK